MNTDIMTIAEESNLHTEKQVARYIAYKRKTSGQELTDEEMKAAEEYRQERNWYENQWRRENRERYNESQRRWKERNRERVKAQQKKWRQEHPEYYKQYMKGYRIKKAFECGRERVISHIENKQEILESQPLEVRKLVEKIKQIRERRRA